MSRLDSGVQGIHPGVHQTSHCYCVVICGSEVDSTRGGFPKKSLWRWRYAEPRPPAYVFGPKGTGKQGLGGSDGHLAPSGPRFGLWGPPRHPSRDRLRERSSTRLSRVYPIHTLGRWFLSLRKVSAEHFPIRRDPLRRTRQLDHVLLRQVAVEPPIVEAQRDD